jgi:uncharacterized membrane protein
MNKGRLEAFSDGVLAIIITIMVLELKVPHCTALADLTPLIPVGLSYLLSFTYIGIYWSNHHHMMATCHKVDGSVLWANLHLLFWRSLVPFVTAWMGENHFQATPSAVYGVVLLMAALAYYLLQSRILRLEGPDSALAAAVGRDWKGKMSPVIYIVAIPLAYVNPWIAGGLYVAVAAMWIVPDPRIENQLHRTRSHTAEP